MSTIIEHTLFIDSRDAHISKSNVDFSILLNGENTYPGEIYKNVVSVEMTAVSFVNGNTLSTGDEHYFVLDIDELRNRIRSNTKNGNRAFATIYYDPSKTGLQLIKGHDFDVKTMVFNPPLSSLSRFSFQIRSGNDTVPINSSYNGYFTMMFKIKTLHI